jgi:hypothetical protein
VYLLLGKENDIGRSVLSVEGRLTIVTTLLHIVDGLATTPSARASSLILHVDDDLHYSLLVHVTL